MNIDLFSQQAGWWRGLYTLPRIKMTALSLALASLFINVLSLALPVTLIQVYDRILPNQGTATLTWLVIGVSIALLLEVALRTGRSYVSGWMGVQFETRVGASTFGHLLQTGIVTFEKDGLGVHLDRLNAVNILREFYSGQAFQVLLDLPFIFLFIGAVWYLAGALALVPLTAVLIFTLVVLIAKHKFRQALDDRTVANDRRYNFVIEILSGIHTVKSMAMEEQMLRRYERLQEGTAETNQKVTNWSMSPTHFGSFFSQATLFGIVGFGGLMVIHGELTIGALTGSTLLASRAMQIIQGAAGFWLRFSDVQLARQRLAEVAELPTEIPQGLPPFPQKVEGHIELKDVSFRFTEEGPDILNRVNFSAKPGETIGVVGDSASGKTTLLYVMMGALKATHGDVFIDQYNLKNYDITGLEEEVAYLPQMGIMFKGTILDNLTMFRDERWHEAEKAVRLLGLDDALAEMPLGFETMVGKEAHDFLPGGVRQRIAIARALVTRPRVILFDEANVAMDSKGDAMLKNLLQGIKGQCTIILVSHRPSLLELADRVYDLKEGSVIERTPEEGKGPEPKRPKKEPPPCEEKLKTSCTLPDQSTTKEETPAKKEPDPPKKPQQDYDVLFSGFRTISDFANCLQPLLEALGWKGSTWNVIEALPHFADDLDMTGLRNVLANLNFHSRVERVRFNKLDSRLMPCLFIPDKGSVLLVLRQEGNQIIAFDGGVSRYVSLPRKRWSGQAMFFDFMEEDESSGPKKQENWFQGIAERFRGIIVQVFSISLLLNILAFAIPLFMMAVYDKVASTRSESTLFFLIGGMAIVLLADGALRHFRGQILAFASARLGNIVGNEVFRRILFLPPSFTERAAIGAQVARIKDFENVREFFASQAAIILVELPFVLLTMVVLFIIGGAIAVVPVIMIALFFAFTIFFKPLVANAFAEGSTASSTKQEFVIETLTNMRAVRYTGAYRVWLERFKTLTAKSVLNSFHAAQLSAFSHTISYVVMIGSGLATMAVGVTLVIDQAISMGALVACMMLTWRVLGPLRTGFVLLSRVEQLKKSIQQINKLMVLADERSVKVIQKPVKVVRGAVSFARVSLRYTANTDPALLGINFDIKPGEVCSIVGRNGAGRSTLLKLLLGLYHPQAGKILIDGRDVRQMNPVELRQLIGYAPQVSQFFFGTIAQNLRLANPIASEEDLIWAAEQADLLSDIEKLPRGFQTRIGDSKAAQLPSSFRQRMNLARAFVKRPPILLFDEPGNGLDFCNDRVFMQAIERLRGKSTIFIATHRPSHMRLADKMLWLSGGRIRTMGPTEKIFSNFMKEGL
ncbi:peptidase domain-containing ABC transporter [Magnetococcales bacterium HHB-1]